MAIQIIDDPSRNALGSALAQGLSGGLQNLLQHKMQAMQQQRAVQQTASGLQALGFDPKQAVQLAQLDPQTLQLVVKQKIEEPNQRAYAQALSSLLGGEISEQAPQMAPVQQQPLQDRYGISPSQKVQLKKYLASGKGKMPYSPEQLKKLESYLAEPMPVQQAPAQMADESERSALPVFGGLNAKQATEIAKLGMEKQKQARKEKIEAFKLSKDERKAILEAGKSARQNLHDLERMEELEREGKLDTPGYMEFLKRSGFDVPALMNPGSEEFNKIAQSFLRDAKTYLGSRISNFELEQFLKTIPNLSQSPEGRKRVIANLKRFSRISLEYSNALKNVIKENKGVPPLDLLEQVDDKVEKKMDYYADLFKKDLKRPVPESQSRLVTAAQAGLGSLVGLPKTIASSLGGGLKSLAGLL